jgi:hypothetical protein
MSPLTEGEERDLPTVYARLCPALGWTEIDPLTGEVGPFVLKDVYRKYGMIYGVTTRGLHTGRPVPEFDAVSIDGQAWMPLKANISLIPMETEDVQEVKSDVVLGF